MPTTTKTRPRPHQGPYASTADIIRANERAGYHYFDRDTMRFFSSRILGGVQNGRYFVTSERQGFDYGSGRAYTVRVALDDGQIETVGEFLAFGTSGAAHRHARECAYAWPELRCDPYPDHAPDGSEIPRDHADVSPRAYAWRVYVNGHPIGSRDTKHKATQLLRQLRRDNSTIS